MNFLEKVLEFAKDGIKTVVEHPVATIAVLAAGKKIFGKNEPKETCKCNCEPVSEQPKTEEA